MNGAFGILVCFKLNILSFEIPSRATHFATRAV